MQRSHVHNMWRKQDKEKADERKQILDQMVAVIKAGERLRRGKRMWPSLDYTYQHSVTMKQLVQQLSVKTMKAAWRLLKKHCPKLRKMKQPSKKPRDGIKVVQACLQLLGLLPVDLNWWGGIVDHEGCRFLRDKPVHCTKELLQNVVYLDAGTHEPIDYVASAEGLWIEGEQNKPVVENDMLTQSVRPVCPPSPNSALQTQLIICPTYQHLLGV